MNASRQKKEAVAPLCPSAQPGMANCQVLGGMEGAGSAEGSWLQYLNQYVAATDEVLRMAAPAKPTQVFRLAATCEESKCTHFDGRDCQLAKREVQILPAAVSALAAPCIVRANCRWYLQEGGNVCFRCPQVSTLNAQPSEMPQTVAGPEARVPA